MVRKYQHLARASKGYPFHSDTLFCSTITNSHAPLGINPRETYNQTQVSFKPGDVFLFYSDGVSDSRNKAGEFFGLKRLEDVLVENAAKPAQVILNQLVISWKSFTGDAPPWDDLTIVVVVINSG